MTTTIAKGNKIHDYTHQDPTALINFHILYKHSLLQRLLHNRCSHPLFRKINQPRSTPKPIRRLVRYLLLGQVIAKSNRTHPHPQGRRLPPNHAPLYSGVTARVLRPVHAFATVQQWKSIGVNRDFCYRGPLQEVMTLDGAVGTMGFAVRVELCAHSILNRLVVGVVVDIVDVDVYW
jgi:hypothetical protein